MLLGNRDAVTSKNNCFFYTVKFAFHYIFTSHLYETIIFFIYIHTYVDMSPLSQYQKCVNITSVSSSQKEKSRVECSYPSFIPFSDDGPRLKYGSVWQTRARHAKKDKTPTLHNITSQRVTGRECVVRVFFCFFFRSLRLFRYMRLDGRRILLLPMMVALSSLPWAREV